MGWLSLCALAVLAVVDVRVATLDGSTVEGVLRKLDAEGVRIGGDSAAAAERQIALDQVLSIQRLGDAAAPSTSASSSARVGLAGGSRIAIDSVTSDGTTAELSPRNQPPLRVPLKQLRWIRFRGPTSAVDPQWLGLIDRPRAADALVIRRPGDAIDEVSGIVVGISDQSVAFDLDGETMQAPLARLEGVLFAGTAEDVQRSQGSVQVEDTEGSRWVATGLGPGSESEIELLLASGVTQRLKIDTIASVELTGSVVFLAAQQPVEAGYTPYLSIGLPSELSGAWLGPEIVGDRDLVMRAASHVEYRVSETNQTLIGSVAYDSAVTAGGSCVVRVLLDSKPVWEQRLDVADPSPRGFELPLNGARRVRLEVDTGGDGDLGDTLRIRQPRMMK